MTGSEAGAMRSVLAIAVVSLVLASEVEAQLPFQPSVGGDRVAPPSALLATWGTAEQCAAHAAGVTDDMRLLPYVIGEQWIRHGFLYCLITWLAHRPSAEGATALAHMQCGEDTLREYRTQLTLESGRLRIRWSADFTTRPLQRCEAGP